MLGRRKRPNRHARGVRDDRPDGTVEGVDEQPAAAAGVGPGGQGPYDGEAAPEDGCNRLDLGSLLLPVPDGAQLQVEVDRSGPIRAVHLLTGSGQLTVTAFAAPKTGGLWNDVADELVGQLRGDGARVDELDGEWGREVAAVTGQAVLRFLAVDGPRWMLRGVAAGSGGPAQPPVEQLRSVIRHTVVLRGSAPMPVRSPLPLRLPQPLAQQVEQIDGGG